jgi:pimeloyl-ACP methyl ester carboxylesterase
MTLLTNPGPNHSHPAPQEVEFLSAGTTCRAWLTYPEALYRRPLPLVIMAHGFGATRKLRLEPYGRRFNAAGFGTLIFDYRTFGASDGEPRNHADWRRELADWHAALAYGRSLPGVDPDRIVLWGTSFAGGLVVSAAAQDGRVAAIVSQCPMMDGLAASLAAARRSGPLGALRLSAHGLLDRVGTAIGRPPHYIPKVAKPGELGAMTSPDAWQGYLRLTDGGALSQNQVTARSVMKVSQFRPVRDAARVECPALVQICEQDTVAPAPAAEKAARLMKRAEIVRYPVGHFDVYFDDAFERSVSDQRAFLLKHVPPRPAAGN